MKKSNIISNKNIPKINPHKYKKAVDSWIESLDKELVKSRKKWKKARKFNIWYGLITGSIIIGFESYMIGDIILNWRNWKSIFIILVNLLIIGIWGGLIYKSFKEIKQTEIDEREEILAELEKE